jgi:hypothetical protein
VVPDDVLLFRYSALTFNGHRIHYDRRYVTEVEGYPGLIVHGPLIATLLLDLLRREAPEADVASLPLQGGAAHLRPAPVPGQRRRRRQDVRLWAQDHEGWLTMDATTPRHRCTARLERHHATAARASPSSRWNTPSPRRSPRASWPTWARASSRSNARRGRLRPRLRQRVRGLSSHFVWTNRSKESLTLDVKHPRGAATCCAASGAGTGRRAWCRTWRPAPRRGWACPRGAEGAPSRA